MTDTLVERVTDMDPLPDEFLFHYTSAAVLAAIIDSGKFMMGDLSHTNDPRESQALYINVEDESRPGRYVVAEDFDELVRRGIQFMSLTVDHRVPDTPGYFQRGWARARCWSHYGGQHEGVCLAFNKTALLQAAAEAAAPFEFREGTVQYRDRQIDMNDESELLSVDPVRYRVNRRAEAARIRAEWAEPLFFTKGTDWASEREFRILVHAGPDTERLMVSVRESLCAIFLGPDFPSTERTVLRHRLGRADFMVDLPVFDVGWHHGMPYAQWHETETQP